MPVLVTQRGSRSRCRTAGRASCWMLTLLGGGERDAPRRARPGPGPRLRDLHLRHDRPAQGGAGRAPAAWRAPWRPSSATFGFGPDDRMPCLALVLVRHLPLRAAGAAARRRHVRPGPAAAGARPGGLVAELGRCTLLHAVPALMRQVVDRRAAGAAGAGAARAVHRRRPVPADLLADLRAPSRSPGGVLYGPTEATIVCAVRPVPREGRPRLAPGAAVRRAPRSSAATRTGEPVPIGVPGRALHRRRRRRPRLPGPAELTAERFVRPRDGRRLYRTGDLVRCLPDGALEFLGRVDQPGQGPRLPHRAGRDRERALLRHPEVREAVVAVREDAAGERLVAYVVPPPPSAARTSAASRREQSPSGRRSTTRPTAAERGRRRRPSTSRAGTAATRASRSRPRRCASGSSARSRASWPCEPRRVAGGRLRHRPAAVPRGARTPSATSAPTSRASPWTASAGSSSAGRPAAGRAAPAPADDWSGVGPGDVRPRGPQLGGRSTSRAPTTWCACWRGPCGPWRPGGAVFVGDVRSLPLLEAFHASVELFQAPAVAGRRSCGGGCGGGWRTRRSW